MSVKPTGVSSVTMGQRLAEARSDLNMTQKEVARILDVSGTAVSNWERDEDGLSTDHLIKVIDLYKIRFRWLLEGVGPKRIAANETVYGVATTICDQLERALQDIRKQFI